MGTGTLKKQSIRSTPEDLKNFIKTFPEWEEKIGRPLIEAKSLIEKLDAHIQDLKLFIVSVNTQNPNIDDIAKYRKGIAGAEALYQYLDELKVEKQSDEVSRWLGRLRNKKDTFERDTPEEQYEEMTQKYNEVINALQSLHDEQTGVLKNVAERRKNLQKLIHTEFHFKLRYQVRDLDRWFDEHKVLLSSIAVALLALAGVLFYWVLLFPLEQRYTIIMSLEIKDFLNIGVRLLPISIGAMLVAVLVYAVARHYVLRHSLKDKKSIVLWICAHLAKPGRAVCALIMFPILATASTGFLASAAIVGSQNSSHLGQEWANSVTVVLRDTDERIDSVRILAMTENRIIAYRPNTTETLFFPRERMGCIVSNKNHGNGNDPARRENQNRNIEAICSPNMEEDTPGQLEMVVGELKPLLDNTEEVVSRVESVVREELNKQQTNATSEGKVSKNLEAYIKSQIDRHSHNTEEKLQKLTKLISNQPDTSGEASNNEIVRRYQADLRIANKKLTWLRIFLACESDKVVFQKIIQKVFTFNERFCYEMADYTYNDYSETDPMPDIKKMIESFKPVFEKTKEQAQQQNREDEIH